MALAIVTRVNVTTPAMSTYMIDVVMITKQRWRIFGSLGGMTCVNADKRPRESGGIKGVFMPNLHATGELASVRYQFVEERETGGFNSRRDKGASPRSKQPANEVTPQVNVVSDVSLAAGSMPINGGYGARCRMQAINKRGASLSQRQTTV